MLLNPIIPAERWASNDCKNDWVLVKSRQNKDDPQDSLVVFSRNVLISIHQGRILLADLDTVRHVTNSLPLEEAELPQNESDDDHHQEARHDGDHHHPDGDVGNASF